MSEELDLAKTAVGGDLFGAEGLSEEDIPPAPDKYVIQRQLGRGGAGAVYLAMDTNLRRPVALKYLNYGRPAEIDRFFREARFAARLRDPSIVQIYEAGDVDGMPYIAMQYIPGGNLATAALDVPTIIRVLRQVASALAHAHQEGIVHRDIKPENILVDGEQRAYITDFGIARDLRGELGATISEDGQILGTPGLMSPEQARGEVRAVDARTDIYALGATLYFKLTGRYPFSADTLVDLLHAVIHEEPVFPRSFRANIPRDLEAIVLRCLRKRRDERYASMQQVIDAFDQHLSGAQSTNVSSLWFSTFVRQRVDEASVPAAPTPPTSERDWLPALEAAQEIAEWDAQLYRVRSDLSRYFPRLDGLIWQLTLVLDERPATGWARFYRGVAWFRRGDLGRALEDMERSIDRVGDLAGAHFELGRLYLAMYLNEHQAAHQHLSLVGTEDQLKAAQSGLALAQVAFAEAGRLRDLPPWQLRYAEAVGHLAKSDYVGCDEACDRILTDEPDLEDVWKLKGDALRRLGKDPFPAYERALETRRSYYEVALAMADVHVEAGRLNEARSCLSRALEIYSGLPSAQFLMARTYLLEARACPELVEWARPERLIGLRTGSAERVSHAIELLTQGLERAEALVREYPDRYDGAIVVAEVQIEMARASADAERIGFALASLERASHLQGCGNRVAYLQATARLTRARLASARGEDPTDDLESVLAARAQANANVPDNAPWVAIFEEAEQLLLNWKKARS